MLDDLIESALKNLQRKLDQEIYDSMTDSQRMQLRDGRFDSASTTSSTFTNIPFQWPPTTLWFYDRRGNFLWDKVMPWKPFKELPSTYSLMFHPAEEEMERIRRDGEIAGYQSKRFRYCYKVDQVAIYQED